MPIIAILNTKGGAGKTTLTTNLAHGLKTIFGHSVKIIDSDPQGSASQWYEAGGKELLPVIRKNRTSLDRDLSNETKEDEWIIIDGAPRADELTAAAIRVADVILIPVQPSPYDIWASQPVVKAIKFHQHKTNPKLKAAFVTSRAVIGTSLAKSVKAELAKYELPIFENMTHQRVFYAETVANGQTVIEDKNSKAAAEIINICHELNRFINDNQL